MAEVIRSQQCPSKVTPQVPVVNVDGTEVERVDHCTLLGVQISSKLSWDGHCNKILKKANQKLFFIKQLKRAKISPTDIIATYLAVVRPVLEYACQVWHPGLTAEQHESLEKIQERAVKIANPQISYEHALLEYNIPTLKERRDTLCKKLFNEMKKEDHKLHALLPEVRDRRYATRRAYDYPLPKCHTERYKMSFIPYCLFNFQ